MPRAVDGTRRKDRRKKILKQAKGYRGKRSVNFRTAKDSVAKAGVHAYRDRRRKKRDFRRLWIARISAGTRAEGMTYSRFVNGLLKAGVLINRKALAVLAVDDPAAFKLLVDKARGAADA